MSGSWGGGAASAVAQSKPRSTVLGIDPSREYVAYANHRNEFPARVVCETGDAQQLRFPDATFGRLWTQGGLDRVREQPLDIDIRFASFADCWDPFLLGQGPAGAHVRRIGKDRVSALRAAVRRRLAASAESSPFTLRARAWAVRGEVPVPR